MTVHLDDVNENLLPRRYQEEIFSRAQERNVIAALDTGSGKTYISTLLIKWIAAENAGNEKVIVFLVPKVALVEQQGDFIAKETSLRVSKCYGATAIDLADRRGWRKEIQNHDVLVMTAQIFLNILTHSHWSMNKVSLMVFDECHHTRKNHAYNGIMREYFQWPQDQRPKVFGMTASPIWNPRDAVESLATLERNLDAKVIAVREHVDELMDHSPKPVEIIHEFPNPPDGYPLYAPTSLWERLDLSSLPPEMDIPVSKIRTRYEVTYNSLGLFGAELFLYIDIKHRIEQFINQLEGDVDYPMAGTSNDMFLNQEAKLPQELAERAAILDDYKEFFEGETDSDVVPIRVDLRWVSPKGIVFVEQRHVAACLAKMLPRIPQLENYIRSAQLIGHGASSMSKSQVRGMGLRTQQDIVKMFRDREVNLLVATSVAEEGLDFPACELVIRFDPIQHMVGYIQSRGRARQKTATFIVMVQEGLTTHVERYKAFSESEPHLRRVYQTREENPPAAVEEEEEGEITQEDLDERERFVVPSTGAVLTYNTAIGLLNHLCSLIPRDRFTPVHVPQYAGEFQATLQLPSSLPLPPEHLVFTGPNRISKKEAKRAVAFLAVKSLHALNVFDDYLLPAKAHRGDHEDADGRPIGDVSDVPDTMDVLVRDPWIRGSTKWIHIVYLDGNPSAGLVTGTQLPEVDLVCNGVYVSIGSSIEIRFDEDGQWRQLRMMDEYMRMGLWWCTTGRGITFPLTCCLVPINDAGEILWESIERALKHPFGYWDWSEIGEEHFGRLLVMCAREHGRPLILKRFREDLTPHSVPPDGTREAGYATYRHFFISKYSRGSTAPDIPEEGLCLEAIPYPRNANNVYSLNGAPVQATITQTPAIFIQSMCRWAAIPEDVYRTFHVLPELCQRITDIYRARICRFEMGLPPIGDDLLVQALTIPSCNAGFNNQRLETLGDAVLKLSTVVHLYNRFPHRHEGQLDVLRRNSVSNRTLLARAKEQGLEQFITSEPRTTRIWRYTVGEEYRGSQNELHRSSPRKFPRRSLQDCMEATLGAAYVTGGVSMALRTGTALGLSLGGPLPWSMRYGRRLPESPVAALFKELQEILNYEFKSGALLVEAVCHPSFRSPGTSSYQRLEFLGDALIDLVVMHYLFRKFPHATSGQLSWARSRAVCSPALASVAVNRLGLHRMLLINNVELSVAISKYVPILEETSSEDIILNGWKHDPPKAISDVLESLLGAVLVDSGYNYEKASVVTEAILQDLLVVLSPEMPRDPVSDLMIWSAQSGCTKISFRKSQSRPELKRNDCISVIVHDFAVVGPIPAANLSLAKGLAAERARQVLEDPNSPFPLVNICDCTEELVPDAAQLEPGSIDLDGVDEVKHDDETVEGFASLAKKVVAELQTPVMTLPEPVDDDDDESVNTFVDHRELESLLLPSSLPNSSPNMEIDSDDTL